MKTVRFKVPTYIGDPVNSVRIYNELEVDELIFLDIGATKRHAPPPFKLIAELAEECFMPFSYGGGIKTLADVQMLFDIGVEKVVINTTCYQDIELLSQIASRYGSQSLVVALDIRKKAFSKNYALYSHSGTKKQRVDLFEWLNQLSNIGVGEILINSVDRDGTMEGFDLELIRKVSSSVDIPVVALGGGGESDDIVRAQRAGASAVALGSMCVFQNKNRGILINYPSRGESDL